MTMLKGLFLTSVVLLCLLTVMGYEWLNTGISLDHARQEQKYTRQSSNTLVLLLGNATNGISRAQLKELVSKSLGQNYLLKEQPDKIEVEGIVFTIRNDQVVNVTLLSSGEK